MTQAKGSLARLRDFIYRLKNDPFPEGKSPEVEKVIAESLKSFEDAFDDDLNVSGALAAMFEVIRSVNKLADSRQLFADDVAPIQAALKKMDRVLGITDFPEDSISAEVEVWIEKRNAARRPLSCAWTGKSSCWSRFTTKQA